MQGHSFTSNNSVRSFCITTTYNNSTICNTITVKIKDVDFLIDNLSFLAIRCVRLLESQSAKILNVNQTIKVEYLK